jgi:hypothetical protein
MKLLFENWRKYVKENEESFEEEPEEAEESEGSGYPSKIARLILSGEDHGVQARELVLTLPSVNIGDVFDAFMYEVMKKIKPLVNALLELREAEAKRKSWEQHNAGLITDRIPEPPEARVIEKKRHYSELDWDFYEFTTLANGGILTFLFPEESVVAPDAHRRGRHRLGIRSDDLFLRKDEHRRVIVQLSQRGDWGKPPTDSPAYNFEPANWAEIKRLSEKRQLYERLWEKSLEKSGEEGPDETSI